MNKLTRDDVYLSLMGELDGRLSVMQSKEGHGQLTQTEYELFLILSNIRALIPVLYVPDKDKPVEHDSYPPIGVTVLNQDNEPVFWGGVNWWSAKLHDWRIVTVTSWRDVVQSDQSTAVEVDA